jgi:hypothetical protein
MIWGIHLVTPKALKILKIISITKALDSFRKWEGLNYFRRQYPRFFTDTVEKSNGVKGGNR